MSSWSIGINLFAQVLGSQRLQLHRFLRKTMMGWLSVIVWVVWVGRFGHNLRGASSPPPGSKVFALFAWPHKLSEILLPPKFFTCPPQKKIIIMVPSLELGPARETPCTSGSDSLARQNCAQCAYREHWWWFILKYQIISYFNIIHQHDQKMKTNKHKKQNMMYEAHPFHLPKSRLCSSLVKSTFANLVW